MTTKERILQAAFRLFSRDGFDGVSVRAITEAAGVNQAAVNYHFGSKTGLFRTVVEHRMTGLVAQVHGAMTGPGDYGERFRMTVMVFVEHVLANARWMQMLVREVLSGGSRLPLEADQQLPRLDQHLQEFLAEGVEQGHLRAHEPMLGAMSVMSMLVYAVVVQDRLSEMRGVDVSDESFRQRLAEHHATLLWRGLAT